ncbi:MAG: anti-sigma factor [Winogradskyella sp.]|uniref:anti-sigma factor n=1 Tax=Winogradskyella sp. TaxID=1883156 RepID=UPI000F40665B|nr:anti-sigma factor [Winogradskyella sp.]RNC84927.1 MAG: anti-sigma factor [Winogradskyella sp.]
MKMTKEDIIKEGLLEQYVLGELNEKEESIIEQLRISDSEIAALLDDIELNFENLAQENSINPPEFVKRNVLLGIKKTETSTSDSSKLWLRVAAGFAGLFLLGNIWLYSEMGTIKNDLKIVSEQNESLQKDLNNITQDYVVVKNWNDELSNPDAQQYILKGNTLSPETKIVSFVNHENKSVIINTQELPELDKDHDYQMWADVDGEMINMGVIAKDKTLMAMTYIENAESLNVTIEPLGGNDHPTVERLITNVYLD